MGPDRPSVADVMDERPEIGTKRTEGGHQDHEVSIGRDESPVQQSYPLAPMLLMVVGKPFHVPAMR